MKKLKIVLCMLICFSMTGCSFHIRNKVITIGSANNDESVFIAETIADTLEEKGFIVNKKYNLNPDSLFDELKSGYIDLYPGYLDDLYKNKLKQSRFMIGNEKYSYVKKNLNKSGVTLLQPFLASASMGFSLNLDVAKEMNIKSISDLKKVSHKFTLGVNSNYNSYGAKRLEEVYGKFNWKAVKSFKYDEEDLNVKYNYVDVITSTTTNGQLERSRLRTLKDNKKAFRNYNNIVPVVSKKYLEENKSLSNALEHLSKVMSTRLLREYTAKIDDFNTTYRKLALAFMSKEM
ncbi:glycine betaine/choline-binding (lipo)protein of an ABC-type transport system (osmoprotectant binding protein) [Kandleria vitulina]|uniref:ABC transporter substrate-binding protein n=1 Tax=Kandleria vitulina TaxID=1630 RepID=UPI0008878CC7|nr:glycine betaine ABC transporter substrate-binding protein [Kandleria vitulina]SDM17827.1 glycine betaine/choline-binding (lipo)protein of an ABC-type transport system (osmoprotectant binding protein) [Kandleria vitulina]